MLVLSRLKNEKCVITLKNLISLIKEDPTKLEEILSQEIEVVICEIRGDKVRIGFNAPTDIPVHRLEVWESIKRGNTTMQREY